MNIKSILARIGTCCGSTKKEKEQNQVKENKADFSED